MFAISVQWVFVLATAWYDPESDLVRSLIMMLQFFFRSGSNSDTLPSNSGSVFVLLLEPNIVLVMFPSCLYQVIFSTLPSVVTEHARKTHSPACADTFSSLCGIMLLLFGHSGVPEPEHAKTKETNQKRRSWVHENQKRW